MVVANPDTIQKAIEKGEPITEPLSLQASSAEDAITKLFNSAADKFGPSAAIFSPPLVFGLPAPFRKRL